MKISKPFLTICFLLVCLIGVTVWAFRERGGRLKAQNEAERSKIVTSAAASLVKQFTDTGGQNHSTFSDDLSTTVAQLKQGKSAISKPLLDTVSKALDILPENVTKWMRIAYQNEARALRAEKSTDSLQRATYYYKDKYLQLAYRPAAITDTVDTNGTFDYKYNADLEVTQYAKRSRVLGFPIGAKESFIDITSRDKRTTISGLETFTVKQDRPLFGLRLQAVSSYNFTSGEILGGPGLQFDIRKLSFTGAYLYGRQRNEWRYNIAARYDLITF